MLKLVQVHNVFLNQPNAELLNAGHTSGLAALSVEEAMLAKS